MNNIDLKQYADLFKGYTELRAQRNNNVNISLVDGTVMGNSKNSASGVSARSFKDGSWGFASTTELNSESIKHVINAASSNAIYLDRLERKGLSEFPATSTFGEFDFSTKRPIVSQKGRIDFARDLDNYIAKKFTKLTSRTVSVIGLDMEKQILTSTGTSAYSLIPRSSMYVLLTVDSSSGPIDLYDVFGGLGQFEDVFINPSDYYSKLDKLYEHLLKKSEGVFANSGVKDVILDPNIAGILAHEAIGHTTEADLVKGGSVAADYMDQVVASPLVNLVDYANTAFGETCPVPVFVDDEGTAAKDVTIIEDGILRSYMHNKESAHEFGVAATGNARAYRFSDEPLIRMRNTAILPGTSKLSEMIESVDDGYYLISSSNGQADTTSEFMFGVVLGYEIKNGKLGKAIKDTTISGIAFDMLKTVTAISDDMSWGSGGMCGKKQPIPVGMGGPAIKCKINIGGR